MYATIRRYVGNPGLADELVPRKGEVIELMRSVPGLHAYYLIKAGDDTISVTITDDESGSQRSSEIAAGWIRDNVPDAVPSSPEISAGEVAVAT